VIFASQLLLVYSEKQDDVVLALIGQAHSKLVEVEGHPRLSRRQHPYFVKVLHPRRNLAIALKPIVESHAVRLVVKDVLRSGHCRKLEEVLAKRSP